MLTVLLVFLVILRREGNDFTTSAAETFHDPALRGRRGPFSYEPIARRAVLSGSAALPICHFFPIHLGNYGKPFG